MRGLDQNTRSWRNIRIKTFQVEARPVRPYLLGGRRMWRKPEDLTTDLVGPLGEGLARIRSQIGLVVRSSSPTEIGFWSEINLNFIPRSSRSGFWQISTPRIDP